MIIHREIGPSYHNKCIVQGVNYSSLMVESKEEKLVKEEKWTEVIPAAVPPPIFLLISGNNPHFVFLNRLLSGTPRGPFI
jgi:hypothetical protein